MHAADKVLGGGKVPRAHGRFSCVRVLHRGRCYVPSYLTAFYIPGISVGVCVVILVVVLFLIMRALVVVVGFRVTLSLLECYLLLVFLESSLGAFVAGAHLLRLAVWAGGGLPTLRAYARTLVGLSSQITDLPLLRGILTFCFWLLTLKDMG